MKRKYENDQSIQTSKKRRTSSMPLVDKLTLYNLHGLQSVNGPYCLRLDLGLAVIEGECETCHEQHYTENNEHDIDKIIEEMVPFTKKKCDLYKIDALLRDLWQTSKATKVDFDQNENGIAITLHNVSHVSWFSIQLILHNSPVEQFEATRKKLTIHLPSKDKADKKKVDKDSDILRDMLVVCHRNVYHMLFSHALVE